MEQGNDPETAVDPFEGLHPEGPSEQVREHVLAVAGARLGSRRRARRRKWLVAGGLAAGMLLAVTLARWDRRSGSGPPEIGVQRPGSSASNSRGIPSPPPPSAALRGALRELRADFEAIDEMTSLIHPEREDAKRTILERVQACLADLDELDRQVSVMRESSEVSPDERKEKSI